MGEVAAEDILERWAARRPPLNHGGEGSSFGQDQCHLGSIALALLFGRFRPSLPRPPALGTAPVELAASRRRLRVLILAFKQHFERLYSDALGLRAARKLLQVLQRSRRPLHEWLSRRRILER